MPIRMQIHFGGLNENEENYENKNYFAWDLIDASSF